MMFRVRQWLHWIWVGILCIYVLDLNDCRCESQEFMCYNVTAYDLSSKDAKVSWLANAYAVDACIFVHVLSQEPHMDNMVNLFLQCIQI